MLIFSICNFPLSAVEDFLTFGCDWPYKPILIKDNVKKFLKLKTQNGSTMPALGYFYYPRSNKNILLFTTNSGDGWLSLLSNISLLKKSYSFYYFRYSNDPLLVDFRFIQHFLVSRLVYVMDDGRLLFHEEGLPLSFENEDAYKRRRKKDRLTFEMLNEYAIHLGLDSISDSLFETEDEYIEVIEGWPEKSR